MFGINCATSSWGSFEFKSLQRGSTLPFAMIFNHRLLRTWSNIPVKIRQLAVFYLPTNPWRLQQHCYFLATNIDCHKTSTHIAPLSLQIDACFKNKKALAFRHQDTPERKTNRALWGPWGPSGGSCDLRKQEITKEKRRFPWRNP